MKPSVLLLAALAGPALAAPALPPRGFISKLSDKLSMKFYELISPDDTTTKIKDAEIFFFNDDNKVLGEPIKITNNEKHKVPEEVKDAVRHEIHLSGEGKPRVCFAHVKRQGHMMSRDTQWKPEEYASIHTVCCLGTWNIFS